MFEREKTVGAYRQAVEGLRALCPASGHVPPLLTALII